MNIEEFRTYCLQKKAVTESFPFDDKVLVFKVMNKIFALTNVESDEFAVNLKCDPIWAQELRNDHKEVQPGYHMNKKHWNTVSFNGNLPNQMLQQLIHHSYDLVVAGLTKKQQKELNNQ